MHISDNHPFMTSSTDVAEIIKPLRKLGISHFSYLKSEANGKRTYLFNDASFLRPYLDGKYYLTGNTECKPTCYKSLSVLWSTLPNQHIFDNLARSRDIDHGIFIFQPNKEYCESFSFATEKNNPAIINLYINHADILEKFINYFKEAAAPLINPAEQHKIVLPFNQLKLDFFELSDMDLISEQLSSQLATKRFPLTKRQVECSIHLVNGKTAKEIAELTGLSFRTVEYYINNIKSKLNCKNRAALIVKLATILK